MKKVQSSLKTFSWDVRWHYSWNWDFLSRKQSWWSFATRIMVISQVTRVLTLFFSFDWMKGKILSAAKRRDGNNFLFLVNTSIFPVRALSRRFSANNFHLFAWHQSEEKREKILRFYSTMVEIMFGVCMKEMKIFGSSMKCFCHLKTWKTTTCVCQPGTKYHHLPPLFEFAEKEKKDEGKMFWRMNKKWGGKSLRKQKTSKLLQFPIQWRT